MKTFKVKSSAVRWAKKEIGPDFKEKGDIVEKDGLWSFVPTPVEEPKLGKPKLDILRKSSMDGACSMVWDIAGSMLAENPDTKRKEILQACVDSGIAFYTARTQYQKYREACKNDAANA